MGREGFDEIRTGIRVELDGRRVCGKEEAILSGSGKNSLGEGSVRITAPPRYRRRKRPQPLFRFLVTPKMKT